MRLAVLFVVAFFGCGCVFLVSRSARRGVSPFAPFFRDLCVPCYRGSLGETDWLTAVSVAGAYAAGLAAWNCPVLVASFVLIYGMRAWAYISAFRV